ncbi:cyanate transporter [Cupriavidus sp. USMAHM13]|uniref:cyanate transporter n=1 Tax=Cupriavidus sp. USMAHM13 TaxID=1389192 RepID=UPI0009F1D072
MWASARWPCTAHGPAVPERAVRARPGSRAAWLALVVLVGMNLRPFLTGVGPLAEQIHDGTGLTFRGMAWLTLLPMWLMGVGALLSPLLWRAVPARHAVLGALALLGLGSALRAAWPQGGALIAATAVCGAGVAVIQAVFPGLIKQRSAGQVAAVMGLYSAALMGGGALGAQLTPLLAQWSGNWRGALAAWAAPAWLALLFAWRALPRPAPARPGPAPAGARLLQRPRTWLLMACFGLVNGGYASLVAWLPAFYQSRGWSGTHSGGLLALMALAQAGAALLLPALTARWRDRRPWLWLTLALQAAGFAAFAAWPDLAPRAWAAISGGGLGGCFALCLIVALDHLPDAEQAGELSALMQGGGFLIAATAPWVCAALRDASGGFTAGWLAHLGCVAVVSLLVARLAPRGYGAALSPPGRAWHPPGEPGRAGNGPRVADQPRG